MIAELGIQVVRAIPKEVIKGLILGEYKSYGGVIRWAAGTEKAGQIVRHLVPVMTEQAIKSSISSILSPLNLVGTAINGYQIHRVSKKVDSLTLMTEDVLKVATTTMTLSGLNLAVSAVGFAFLNNRLKNLDLALRQLQKEVKAIRTLLELEEKAKLAAVLRDLESISSVKNQEHRNNMLYNAKNVLAPISLKYKQLLSQTDEIHLAIAYEELFCVTSLAHARCFAELGMLDLATKDLQDAYDFWSSQARRIAKELVIGQNPERFLLGEFSQNVPISVLTEWLDFTYEENKGYEWIDDLRRGLGVWTWVKAKGKSGEELAIPTLHQLTSRNNTLQGYIAQYQWFEEQNITPSQFDAFIEAIPKEDLVDGYAILEPK